MADFKVLYKIYEKRLLKNLDHDRVPKHVAIIMDGNRRFARSKKNMEVTKGHRAGADTLEDVLDWALELGIKIITVYAFSTENFNRPENEVNYLMELFAEYFKKLVDSERTHKNRVKVNVVGRTELLPDFVRETIVEAEESTANYDGLIFNLAIGYDGRLEIVDAVKKIAVSVKSGEVDIGDIDTDLINNNLYTGGLEDPNLIIRTSGEERLSGFLLWQSSYSELYFCDVLWPEFRKIDFLRAIRDYQARDRRFGV